MIWYSKAAHTGRLNVLGATMSHRQRLGQISIGCAYGSSTIPLGSRDWGLGTRDPLVSIPH